MTDFVTRDDANLGVGRIFTSSTAYALYENVIAVTEGGLGAPRIQTAAIDDAQVTTAKIANANVTAAKINLQARSFSGTIGIGSAVTIAVSDLYPLYPRLTASQNSDVAMCEVTTGGVGARMGLRNLDTNATRTFTVSWGYIA